MASRWAHLVSLYGVSFFHGIDMVEWLCCDGVRGMSQSGQHPYLGYRPLQPIKTAYEPPLTGNTGEIGSRRLYESHARCSSATTVLYTVWCGQRSSEVAVNNVANPLRASSLTLSTFQVDSSQITDELFEYCPVATLETLKLSPESCLTVGVAAREEICAYRSSYQKRRPG